MFRKTLSRHEQHEGVLDVSITLTNKDEKGRIVSVTDLGPVSMSGPYGSDIRTVPNGLPSAALGNAHASFGGAASRGLAAAAAANPNDSPNAAFGASSPAQSGQRCARGGLFRSCFVSLQITGAAELRIFEGPASFGAAFAAGWLAAAARPSNKGNDPGSSDTGADDPDDVVLLPSSNPSQDAIMAFLSAERRRLTSAGVRALPVEAVTELQQWLISAEHYDNPYPTTAEKDQLAVATNLSRKQVATWFTNARKRIWAPLRLAQGLPLVTKGGVRVPMLPELRPRGRAKATAEGAGEAGSTRSDSESINYDDEEGEGDDNNEGRSQSGSEEESGGGPTLHPALSAGIATGQLGIGSGAAAALAAVMVRAPDSLYRNGRGRTEGTVAWALEGALSLATAKMPRRSMQPRQPPQQPQPQQQHKQPPQQRPRPRPIKRVRPPPQPEQLDQPRRPRGRPRKYPVPDFPRTDGDSVAGQADGADAPGAGADIWADQLDIGLGLEAEPQSSTGGAAQGRVVPCKRRRDMDATDAKDDGTEDAKAVVGLYFDAESRFDDRRSRRRLGSVSSGDELQLQYSRDYAEDRDSDASDDHDDDDDDEDVPLNDNLIDGMPGKSAASLPSHRQRHSNSRSIKRRKDDESVSNSEDDDDGVGDAKPQGRDSARRQGDRGGAGREREEGPENSRERRPDSDDTLLQALSEAAFATAPDSALPTSVREHTARRPAPAAASSAKAGASSSSSLAAVPPLQLGLGRPLQGPLSRMGGGNIDPLAVAEGSPTAATSNPPWFPTVLSPQSSLPRVGGKGASRHQNHTTLPPRPHSLAMEATGPTMNPRMNPGGTVGERGWTGMMTPYTGAVDQQEALFLLLREGGGKNVAPAPTGAVPSRQAVEVSRRFPPGASQKSIPGPPIGPSAMSLAAAAADATGRLMIPGQVLTSGSLSKTGACDGFQMRYDLLSPPIMDVSALAEEGHSEGGLSMGGPKAPLLPTTASMYLPPQYRIRTAGAAASIAEEAHEKRMDEQQLPTASVADGSSLTTGSGSTPFSNTVTMAPFAMTGSGSLSTRSTAYSDGGISTAPGATMQASQGSHRFYQHGEGNVSAAPGKTDPSRQECGDSHAPPDTYGAIPIPVAMREEEESIVEAIHHVTTWAESDRFAAISTLAKHAADIEYDRAQALQAVALAQMRLQFLIRRKNAIRAAFQSVVLPVQEFGNPEASASFFSSVGLAPPPLPLPLTATTAGSSTASAASGNVHACGARNWIAPEPSAMSPEILGNQTFPVHGSN
jgi:hypothetical protein